MYRTQISTCACMYYMYVRTYVKCKPIYTHTYIITIMYILATCHVVCDECLIWPPTYPPTGLATFLHLYRSTFLPIYLPTHQSIHLYTVYLYMREQYVRIYIHIHIYIYIYIYK